MNLTAFLREYLVWHYAIAPRELIALWKNFLWFGYHFFSISLLSQTLISPFYRIQEKTSALQLLNPQEFLGNVAANIISRLVGLLLRSSVLALGFTAEVLLVAALFPALVLWLMLPVVATALFATGAILLL
jgi:hypothetical protein